MARRLEGQRALVTGASSGIGAALARRLAAEGAQLVITARREEQLNALATDLREAYQVEVRVEAMDLTEDGAARALFERTEGRGQAVDLLINNAGFGHYDEFIKIPWERHASMLQLNVVALTELCRLFVPKMIERGRGRVMNVASMAAYLPCPLFSVYAATKAYVSYFSEGLDYELKGSGVRAIAVCPGGVHSEFADSAQMIVKSTLFHMSSERCASIAVSKMLAGRRRVIPGFLNSLLAMALRFVPYFLRPLIANLSMRLSVDPATPALPRK